MVHPSVVSFPCRWTKCSASQLTCGFLFISSDRRHLAREEPDSWSCVKCHSGGSCAVKETPDRGIRQQRDWLHLGPSAAGGKKRRPCGPHACLSSPASSHQLLWVSCWVWEFARVKQTPPCSVTASMSSFSDLPSSHSLSSSLSLAAFNSPNFLILCLHPDFFLRLSLFLDLSLFPLLVSGSPGNRKSTEMIFKESLTLPRLCGECEKTINNVAFYQFTH